MTNEMTAEEAVKQIKENCYFASISEKTKQALDKAIKALEQQPCEDCISREAVLQYFMPNEAIHKVIEALPSVKPKYTDEEIDKIQAMEQAYVDKMVELAVEEAKRPKGHWIIIDDCELFMAKCSECGEIVDSRMINKYPYCHCGAEMSGGGEE